MAHVTTSMETDRTASKLSGRGTGYIIATPNTHGGDANVAPRGTRSIDQCLAVFLCKRLVTRPKGRIPERRKSEEKATSATMEDG